MSWLGDFAASAHESMAGEVRQQLWGRGVSDAQIDLYGMGCLHGARLPDDVSCSEAFRAWWQFHRSRFKDALVFPMTNTLGLVHGLQFRDLDIRTKGYLDYVEVKEEPAFFGLAQAMPSVWQSGVAWLAEGVFDVCPIQRHVPNVFSTLHAGVPVPLRRLLRRVARTLVVAYDMDKKGRDVAHNLSRDLKGEFEIKIVKFPRPRFPTGRLAKDPNELWSVWGDETLGAFIKRCCA